MKRILKKIASIFLLIPLIATAQVGDGYVKVVKGDTEAKYTAIHASTIKRKDNGHLLVWSKVFNKKPNKSNIATLITQWEIDCDSSTYQPVQLLTKNSKDEIVKVISKIDPKYFFTEMTEPPPSTNGRSIIEASCFQLKNYPQTIN